MKTLRNDQYISLAAAALLLTAVYRLVRYPLWEIFGKVPYVEGPSDLMAYTLCWFVGVTLCYGMLLLAIALPTFSFGKLSFLLKMKHAERIYNVLTFIRSRNKKDRWNANLISIVALGTFYALFLHSSREIAIWSTLLFSILILFLQQTKRIEQDMVMYTTMILLVFANELKLVIRDTKALLSYEETVWLSMIGGTILSGVILYRFYKNDIVNTVGAYLLLLGMFAPLVGYMYFQPLLTAANYYLDDSKGSAFPAFIIKVMPDNWENNIILKLPYEGKIQEIWMDAGYDPEKSYHPGDTVSIQVHKGFFGFPWYEDNLGDK